jgi:N-ethylmaleimide reductase
LIDAWPDLAYLHIVFADPDQPLFHELRKRWRTTLIANPWVLANPDLVHRLRIGAPLNPVRDRYFTYVGGETGYTDYPAFCSTASTS